MVQIPFIKSKAASATSLLKKAASLLALLGIALVLGNCTRAELTHGCKESNTIMLPQHMLDYFYFKTGSWWVYVQEGGDRSKRDSVWVSSDRLFFDNPEKAKKDCGCAKGWCAQSATVDLRNHESDSLQRRYFIEYTMNASNLTDADERESQYHNLDRSFFGGSVGPIVFYKKNQFQNSNNRKDEINTLNEVLVNKITFKSVFHTKITNGSLSYFIETFHVKNIGLIKFLKGDSTTWVLVNYKIVL